MTQYILFALLSIGTNACAGVSPIASGGGARTIFYQDYTTVQTTTTFDTGEIVFATATIPANTLNRVGDCLRITSVGKAAANTNSKTWRVRWGAAGTSSGTVTAQSSSNSGQGLGSIAQICKTASSAQYLGGEAGSVAGSGGSAFATKNETVDNFVNVSCSVATGGQGDCSFGFVRVEYIPAP